MQILLALCIALLTMSLAGCAEEGDSYRLGGAFTAERTQADLDEFASITAEYSDDVLIMESFPEQFAINHMHHGCEELRAKLLEKSYIASVTECILES